MLNILNLKTFFDMFNMGNKRETKEKEVTKDIKRLLCSCLRDHDFGKTGRYLLIASLPAFTDSEKADKFIRVLRNGNWQDVVKYQTWEGDQDNIEAYIVNTQDSLVLLVINNRFELYFPSDLIFCEVLDSKRGDSLLSFIDRNNWETIIF